MSSQAVAEKLTRLGGYAEIGFRAVHLQDEMGLLANERAAAKQHDQWLNAAREARTSQPPPPPENEANEVMSDDMGNLSLGDQTHTHYHLPATPQPATAAPAPAPAPTPAKTGVVSSLAKAALLTAAGASGLGGAGAIGYLASQYLSKPSQTIIQGGAGTDTSLRLELLPSLPPPQESAP